MAGIEFGVRAHPDQIRQHLTGYLQQNGYIVTAVVNGGLKAEIGSLKKTMLLGAMAGKNFHRSFIIAVNPSAVDPAGQLTAVTINRDTAGSALKGGAIGASKAQGYFDEFAALLRSHFGTALAGERVLA